MDRIWSKSKNLCTFRLLNLFEIIPKICVLKIYLSFLYCSINGGSKSSNFESIFTTTKNTQFNSTMIYENECVVFQGNNSISRYRSPPSEETEFYSPISFAQWQILLRHISQTSTPPPPPPPPPTQKDLRVHKTQITSTTVCWQL